jgi:hypothetical protein
MWLDVVGCGWMWCDERRRQIMEYFERSRIVNKLFLKFLIS